MGDKNEKGTAPTLSQQVSLEPCQVPGTESQELPISGQSQAKVGVNLRSGLEDHSWVYVMDQFGSG